ncbi:hypothetical protein ACFVIM_14870 [Streptomyces sp. NPDC057638]|uniref:hypothetical protein n=1 Tax=Streptomyces sp. NPDC057638 TaxID=3346190 RepID=UPI0036B5EB82
MSGPMVVRVRLRWDPPGRLRWEVDARMLSGAPTHPLSTPMPMSLSLSMEWPVSSPTIKVSRWCARPAREPAHAGGHGPVVDEHIAVDADLCGGVSVRHCADVLYGSRPRTADEAVSWLSRVRAASPGYGLVAARLTAPGWWVAAGRRDPHPLPVRGATPGGTGGDSAPGGMGGYAAPGGTGRDQDAFPLLPSSLHAWLSTGHALAELPAALRSRAAPPGRTTP